MDKKEPDRIQVVLREIKKLQKHESNPKTKFKDMQKLQDLQTELRQLLRAMPNDAVIEFS